MQGASQAPNTMNTSFEEIAYVSTSMLPKVMLTSSKEKEDK